MKKLILITLVLFIMSPVYSFEFIKKSPKAEIKSVLKSHHKAMAAHDIKKIRTFYADNYKSMDGFNLDELEQMLQKTYLAYKNIKYKTKINTINVNENWALVQMSDKTSAKIYPTEIKEIKKEKMGKLEGTSVYNVYLRKENDSWKIVYDDILMEETSLKYGVANKLDMDLITPLRIKNGQDYDLSLKIEKPKDLIALASISREEIVYPPTDYQEKFRKIPELGELERVVKANDKNLDEYAVASIGFSKVSLNEEQTRARIEILGIAYLMKRVNMDRTRNFNEILVGNN
ncbi:MAG: hypothetical protein IJB79_09145 [Candidatus Gastranaerophilales bacterium]|nr:hypothetical protein [Candidatus Gastranaerophilales bacterium]